MRCDEIQQRFVDLLYNERGTPAASPELQAHVRSCPDCRKELEELEGVRGTLKLWQDEPLPRPVLMPVAEGPLLRRRRTPLIILQYAAAAALVVLSFLALANSEFTWNSQGIAFKAHLFERKPSGTDYYTKSEVRDLLKRVLDDSETRMIETNSVMIQRMMDTMEQERWQELRLVSGRLSPNHNKN